MNSTLQIGGERSRAEEQRQWEIHGQIQRKILRCMSETPIEQKDAEGNPLPPAVCLVCGYELTAATSAATGEECRPSPGDYTLCLKCGEIYCFGEGMQIHFPTVSEMLSARQQPREWDLLCRAQRMIRETRPLR